MGYVAAGYSITGVVLVSYVVRMMLRGRALSKQVPAEQRRWM
jgi:heme exporter protein D